MTEGTVYLLLFVLISNCNLSWHFQNQAKFKKSNNFKGLTSEVTQVNTTNMLHCAQLCLQYTSCTGYSFKKHNSECKLYEADTSGSSTNPTDTMSSFYIKVLDTEVSHSDNKSVEIKDMELLQHNPDINLHKACEEGKLDEVEYILTQKLEDINCRGKKGRTPVIVSIIKDHLQVFNYLVERGCDLSLADDNKYNALHHACVQGNIDIVKHILSLNVTHIDSKSKHGLTPVMYAVQFPHESIMNLLISKQCNIKTVDNAGNTVLHLVCKSGTITMVRHILSLNVTDIESKNHHGWTPVMTAVRYGFEQAVKLFISKHCNLTAVDTYGDTILHVACTSGHVNMVKYVLSLNVTDIESKGKRGRTPVMSAIIRGNRPVVDFLVSKHCNMNAVDVHNDTMLHLACYTVKVDMVKYILSLNGTNIDSKGKFEMTPVMSAVMRGREPIVDLLVSKNCNMKAVDDDGNNVIHVACLYRRGKMVKHLLSLGVLTGREKNKMGQTPAQLNPRIGIKIPKECKIN